MVIRSVRAEYSRLATSTNTPTRSFEGNGGSDTDTLVGPWLVRRSSATMRSVCVCIACVIAFDNWLIADCGITSSPGREGVGYTGEAGEATRCTSLRAAREVREGVGVDITLPRAGDGSGPMNGPPASLP